MKLHFTLPVLALSIAATAGTAHADDIQLWTAAGISLIPIERFELEIEPQIRFDENVSRFSAILLATGLKYRIVKWLRVGAGYRTEYERDGVPVRRSASVLRMTVGTRYAGGVAASEAPA